MENSQTAADVHLDSAMENVEAVSGQSSALDSPAISEAKNIVEEPQLTPAECLILKKLTSIFNVTVKHFFQNEMMDSIDTIIDSKLQEYANQSTQNGSILDQSALKNDLDERLTKLEKLSYPKMDKIETKIDSLKKEIESKSDLIKDLVTENEKQKGENDCLSTVNCKPHENDANALITVNQRLSSLEHRVDECAVGLDENQQRQRLENVEFHGIPKQGRYGQNEDCYEIIKDFCDRYLNITIRTYDISIAHRQFNPAEKKKYGKKYIPSIYVKFLNRFIAQRILKSKNLLRNFRNRFGGKYEVKPNLTLKRRLLWDSTECELESYQFKWITNGNVFVKKNSASRPIKVESELTLRQLKTEQDGAKVTSPPPPPTTPPSLPMQSSTLPTRSQLLPRAPAIPARHPLSQHASQAPPPPPRHSLAPRSAIPSFPYRQQGGSNWWSPPPVDRVIESQSSTFSQALQKNVYRPWNRPNVPSRNTLLSPRSYYLSGNRFNGLSYRNRANGRSNPTF